MMFLLNPGNQKTFCKRKGCYHSTWFSRGKIHIIIGMHTLNIDLTKNNDMLILRE